MGKPNGIGLSIGDGALTFDLRLPSHVEDAIWEAVEGAICAGMTVERFRQECAQAWQYDLEERAKADAKEWEKSDA